MNFKEKRVLMASVIASKLINGYRNPSKMQYQRILFIKQDEIGDVCYSTHVFRMIRLQYPKAEISLLCKTYGKELLKASPDIDRFYTSWDELQGKFNLIIDLKVSWKSIFFSLKNWPEIRLDRGTVRLIDTAKGSYPHEAVTNLAVVMNIVSEKNQLIQPYIALNEDDKNAAARFIKANKLQSFAILHIGARMVLKRWPLINFSQLAESLYKERGLSSVLIGDATETEEISKAMKLIATPVFNAAGVLSLTELAALMEKATIYIGNDSGPLHIAALMQIPCLGLYGPAPQHIFYPLGKKTAVIHHVLECNPCDQVHCVHPDNPCIARITMQEVKSKISELLS